MNFLEMVTKGTAEQVKEAIRLDPSVAAAVDENGVSALLLALYNGRSETAQVLLEHRSDLSVFEAAASGDQQRLRELLLEDPSLVHSYAPDGFFPLGLAAFFRQGATVSILLDAGADVAQAARNAMKVTALHAAAASGQVETAKELLARGADPNARQQAGYTALHQAAHSGNVEMARVLLDHGADAHQRTDAGKTPLEFALEGAHEEVASLLREKGAR